MLRVVSLSCFSGAHCVLADVMFWLGSDNPAADDTQKGSVLQLIVSSTYQNTPSLLLLVAID